ncbi:hypothetical protein TWF225_001619 [Orbilia oligospora]|uniref:Uncharacterized protein n=1 Tax=Orbilia oligospora TaxID=2813651 RepID=A0A7C8JX13_ORBOL|nr:hypothetical protein TWF751_005207 [Orbilia oligospora]KAF3164632.1 hypothetical protein TWF225_001619 [Orbilia oligospora]KAF3237076.1 hypothetical protein TWF217_002204 [Orbilia oligospora]KAF3256739.1 hypothetical protein TWF128_005243 [Orbilia oligospora]KAF3292022.1 hypothetical protein TWF132_006267 [Orbilia oligospora]
MVIFWKLRSRNTKKKIGAFYFGLPTDNANLAPRLYVQGIYSFELVLEIKILAAAAGYRDTTYRRVPFRKTFLACREGKKMWTFDTDRASSIKLRKKRKKRHQLLQLFPFGIPY